jgi:hypothetical protein
MEKTWQSIREKDIKILYEKTVKAYEPEEFHYSYEQFRRYITQADLGLPYIDAPSEPPQDDDIKKDIWIMFN